MTQPVYQLSAGTKTETAQLALEQPRSLGEVVVIDAKTPSAPATNNYARAVTLVEQLSKSVSHVTSRKGPSAQLNPVDAWLLPREATRGIVGVLSGFVGAIGAFVSVGTLIVADASWGQALLSCGITAALGGTSYLLLSAESRAEASRTRHAAERLDSRDVAHMLAPYMKARPEERAALKAFVDSQISDLDPIMSPQAALTRDELLDTATQQAERQPELERAMAVAVAIHKLLSGRVSCLGPLHAIEGTIDDASPEERRQIAAMMRQRLFNGEHPVFDAPLNQQRDLYAVMQRAERGEPSKKPELE